jgi:class 3 adenylate cyclase
VGRGAPGRAGGRAVWHHDQPNHPDELLDVRQAIDRAKGYHAFGGPSLAAYEHDPLKASLLWHFGFWRLQQLGKAGRPTPHDILPPGPYHGVAVLLADLCSFSSYVRDTNDAQIVRESLMAFYSKARYQIINSGGMLYQFAGDEVIGLFGIPDHPEAFTDAVLDTALALCRIGDSVSQHWQRRIDRVQSASGLHVGIAIGDLQIVSLRPFSRLHVGAIGDCINVAARLRGVSAYTIPTDAPEADGTLDWHQTTNSVPINDFPQHRCASACLRKSRCSPAVSGGSDTDSDTIRIGTSADAHGRTSRHCSRDGEFSADLDDQFGNDSSPSSWADVLMPTIWRNARVNAA